MADRGCLQADDRLAYIEGVGSGDSNKTIFEQAISKTIDAGGVYTLSLYYRSVTNLHLFLPFFDTSASLKDEYGVTGAAIVNGHAVAYNAQDNDLGVTLQGNPVLHTTYWEWKFVSITFKANSSTRKFALHGFASSPNAKAEATMLKLEKGSSATPWTDVADVLKKSGIDIYAEKIVATTDNFEVQNQNGQKTFGVDKDGNLVSLGDASFNGTVHATSGEFTGTIHASILYTTWKKVNIADFLGCKYLLEMCNDVPSGQWSDQTADYEDYEEDAGTPKVLPQKITLFVDENNQVGYSSNMMNITLPNPEFFEGMEVEIFFPGCRRNSADSNAYYSKQFEINQPLTSTDYYYNTNSPKNGYREVWAGYSAILDSISGIEISKVFSSHQHMKEASGGGTVNNTDFTVSSVRLLSVKETYDYNSYKNNVIYQKKDTWRWVLIDRRDCMFTQATSP